jgi:CRISPR-associated protein Csb1
VLAALGLYALALQIEEGYQLRSRCQLLPVATPEFEWLGATASERVVEKINATVAREALLGLYKHAESLGLTWETKSIRLEPEANRKKM